MTLGHINYRVARPTRGRELRAGRPGRWAPGYLVSLLPRADRELLVLFIATTVNNC